MTAPLVSIIMPTFNRLLLLREAIASVRAQTHPNWELIVVDDGSIDGTRDWLASLDEPRLRIVLQTHTGNPARTRNTALAVAGGAWVAFLDDDDLWTPDKLAVQLAGLHRCGCLWSYTVFRRIDHAGRILAPPHRPRQPLGGLILDALLRIQAVVALPTVMVERSCLCDVGEFDESLLHCEDYDLWFRLAARHAVHVEERPLAAVRVHREHMQADRVAVQRHWVRLYAKTATAITDQHLAALCRARRAYHQVQLARALAARGDRVGGLVTLARAAGLAGMTTAWWKAAARVLLPVAVVERLRPGAREER